MLDRLEWADCPEGTAREIMAGLLRVDDAEQLAPLHIEGQIASLPFYRHWRLVRLSIEERKRGTRTPLEDVYALWREDHPPMLLDGTSEPVHDVNDDESLELLESQVADYIRWFCFAIRVDDQAFVLFEEAPKRVAAKNRAAAKEAQPLTPKGRDASGAVLYEVTVVYSGTSFTAVFAVPPDGQITMVDDEPLTVDFPTALTPTTPPLGFSDALQTYLALALVSTPTVVKPPARGRRRASRRPGSAVTRPRSTRPTLVEMVELLLERALTDQAQNRLLEYFNASLPTSSAIQRFAALLRSSSPVVVVETNIPFVEETISEIVNGLPGPLPPLPVCRGEVGLDGNGQEVLASFSLPSEGPAIVLIPTQVYHRVMQVERLAFDIAARELSAIITCERVGTLPQSLRGPSDLVLRLPSLDAHSFETLFERVIGQPAPARWQAPGTQWVKHLLHTDFEHPRRMQLSRDDAFGFVRSQAADRLGAVDPGQGLRLNELHGLGEARQFAEDLIADIHAAIHGRLDWSQVDRGALLVGAPGTGKTTLARAIAKDCGVKFIQASAATWMAEGVSLGPHIQAIRKTFSEARDFAPSILFIDEIDSLGSREQFGNDNNSMYMTEVVNAVLEQMQGLDPTAPVFVLGATNHEERVDPALRRSGRLDRVIRIPRPNSQALDHIYRHYLGVLSGATALGPDLDTTALGGLSVGLTGADVERIVRGAARRARVARRPLSQVDVIAEITGKSRDPSGAPRLTPADLERTATHEAGHALATFLSASKGSDIGFATIVPRDDGTLGFVATLPDERVHLTRRDYEEQLDMFLAGRAAEELRYGKDGVSSGASSDLQSATELATRMVTQLGLAGGDRLLWSDTVSPADLALAGTTLTESYERALAKLREHEPRLWALADELEERQELAGEEVQSILSVPGLSTPMPAILIKLASWTPDDDLELPRSGYGYRPGMPAAELYDSARAWWVLNPERAANYRYAVAIHDGLTRAVWEIDQGSWRPWNTPTMGKSRRRWAFEGRPARADAVEAFVGPAGRRIPRQRPGGGPLFGSGNPIAYWPK